MYFPNQYERMAEKLYKGEIEEKDIPETMYDKVIEALTWIAEDDYRP